MDLKSLIYFTTKEIKEQRINFYNDIRVKEYEYNIIDYIYKFRKEYEMD